MINTVRNEIKCGKFIFSKNFVVVLAAFWVNFCLLGVQRSNAVIFRAFVDVFEVNRKHAAWPSSIFGFFMCVTGALSGFLSHRVSIRTLAFIGAALASASVSICSLSSEMPYIVILYGALQGVGMGLIVPLTHVILNQNFTHNRACALGIAYSGSSAGSFIFPPLTNILLEKFNLQGTFLILGGIMSNSLIGTLLFRKPLKHEQKKFSENKVPYENKISVQSVFYSKDSCKNIPSHQAMSSKSIILQSKPSTTTETKNSFQQAQEVLYNPYFLIISLAYAIYFSSSAIFLMVAVDFAKDRGITTEEGVFLISAFSIGDFAGRLSFGWIADIKCLRRSIIVCCYMTAMGIFVAVFPYFSNTTLLPASVLLGIINGSIIGNHSILLNEYLGIEKLPLAMGFSTCFVGITAFLRPVVIGVFRDQNQYYDNVFLFMGMLQVFVTSIWFSECFAPSIRQRFVTIFKPH